MNAKHRAWKIAGILIGSLVIGITIGVFLSRSRAREAERLERLSAVRLLSFKGIFNPEWLARVKARTGVSVALTEADTPESLWLKLEASTKGGEGFDLVTLVSDQVPLASQLGWLQPLDPSAIANWNAAAPDFRSLPGDASYRELVPILWGLTGILYDSRHFKEAPESWVDLLKDPSLRGKIAVPSSTAEIARLTAILNPLESSRRDLSKALQPLLKQVVLSPDAFSPTPLLITPHAPYTAALMSVGETAFAPATAPGWKFVIPREKGLLWVISLALHRDARNPRSAQKFVDLCLEQDSAIELAKAFHQASTNREIEATDLDRRLKPSYLRQVPLNRVDFYKDYSRAREIREAISQPTPSGTTGAQ